MASIHLDPSSNRYRIRFRIHGQEFQRSIRTKNRKEARAILGRVEETIMLIERGRLVIPDDAELGKFILSDGKVNHTEDVSPIRTINDLFDMYEKSQFSLSKEETTRKTEGTHKRHLRRLLKMSTPINTVKVSTLQSYVDKRMSEKHHGKPIQPDTVKNEVVTFRLIWNWAISQEHFSRVSPTKGVVFPKRDHKPPFMTRKEIERKIQRGGLSDDQISELWESLYLSKSEVDSVLQIAKDCTRRPFIFPMLTVAAHTGARRSEILRSLVDDFDFGQRVVHLREKKKSRSKAITFRAVPMSSELVRTMQCWFASHPGGQHAFVHADGTPFTPNSASRHFTRTFDLTDWKVLHGFHVFRHSFVSNLASNGIDQRLIDEWTGHQTEEMRQRYRHLFPDQQHSAIAAVFG